MLHYLGIMLLTAALVWVFTPMAIRLSHMLGIIDLPSARKPHARPTPLMGGFTMLASFWLTALVVLPKDRALWGLLLGGTAAFMVGFADDYFKSHGKDLSAAPKFLGQVVAAMLLAYFGTQIYYISNPFAGGMIFFPAWFSYLATVIWVVGVMNLINFMDGLDGLAAGITCIVATTLALVAWQMGQTNSVTMAVMVMGITLGFLRFNKFPARIFMGDMGSNLLGFLIGAISVGGSFKSATVVGTLIPVLALGLPIFDTAFNVIRRSLNGQPFYTADLGHTHHRLQRWGLTQVQTVMFMYLISICFSLTALVFLFASRH